MKDTLEVMKSGGVTSHQQLEVVPVLQAIMSAQWLARGLLCNREHYKGKDLLMQCWDVVEALAGFGFQGLVFWKLLCCSSLGHAHLIFRKHAEAAQWLNCGLEAATDQSGVVERCLVGVCYAHLSTVHLELEDPSEAVRCGDFAVEIFEHDLWKLLDADKASEEDKEIVVAILATAYMNRGTCDVRCGKFDSGLSWYSSAEESLQKHGNLGQDKDNDEILRKLKDYVEHATHLQRYTGNSEDQPGSTDQQLSQPPEEAAAA